MHLLIFFSKKYSSRFLLEFFSSPPACATGSWSSPRWRRRPGGQGGRGRPRTSCWTMWIERVCSCVSGLLLTGCAEGFAIGPYVDGPGRLQGNWYEERHSCFFCLNGAIINLLQVFRAISSVPGFPLGQNPFRFFFGGRISKNSFLIWNVFCS